MPASCPYPPLLVSAVLHVVYQLLLMRSFGLGDFGQMYPIARGTAPLVVTVLAAVFLHETPGAWQLTGVAVASAGLLGVALWGIRNRGARTARPSAAVEAAAGRVAADVATGGTVADVASRAGAGRGSAQRAGTSSSQLPALLAAVATGLAIASYTVVDGVGVRAAGSAPGYIAWLMLLEGVPIPAYALLTRRGSLPVKLRPVALRGLSAGALSVLAYGLVLWAQTRAPLAPVAILRESSIIAGAAIGALFFKERFSLPRVAAAALMVGGIALMLHGG